MNPTTGKVGKQSRAAGAKTAEPAAHAAGWVAFVGAGTGDESLLTVRAAALIGRADLVVAAPWIGERLGHLLKPGATLADSDAQQQDPKMLIKAARSGQLVARLFSGDPFMFGNAAADAAACAKARVPFEVVPGVTGMSGCWSAAKIPITWGDDVLSVLPGTLNGPDLAHRIEACDAAIIIKLGANLGKVRAAIRQAGREGAAIYVEHGTQEAERIIRLKDKADDLAPYFSMILIPGEGRRR